MLLNGKTAIVTGGTRGIGYAIVRKFLENGAKVALLGSREETVEKALMKLREENPDWKVSGYWPDLMDTEAVAQTFAKVKEEYGSLDILANNAGLSARESTYTYDAKDFEKVIDLNVNAVFICAQAAAKIMKEIGRASCRERV